MEKHKKKMAEDEDVIKKKWPVFWGHSGEKNQKSKIHYVQGKVINVL